MANQKSEEKKLAFQLFINTSMSQKEIALKVGVTEKSISNWANEENWEAVKKANDSMNTETVAALQTLLQLKIKDNIKKAEEGTFSKNDADCIVEITDSIKKLAGQDVVPLSVYIKVMEEFMESIPHNDKIRVKLADLQMQFLLSKAGKQ